MPYASVNGIDIYYEEYGKGPPVVFAHGAGGNHLSWWQQVPDFSRHYRCITFDHRGWGLSVDTTDGGPEMFTADLEGLLDHLELPEAAFIAQSMGGMTCLGLAMKTPERVRGLVMANTFAGMRREVWLAASDELREDARVIWDRRRQDGIKRALAKDFSQRHRDKAFLYKQIRIMNEEGPNRLQSAALIQRLRALERVPEVSATPDKLQTLTFPVLFIGGEHDEVMPVSLMALANDMIEGARMVVVPGTAHSVYFEQPETFNHVVLEFLAGCLPRNG